MRLQIRVFFSRLVIPSALLLLLSCGPGISEGPTPPDDSDTETGATDSTSDPDSESEPVIKPCPFKKDIEICEFGTEFKPPKVMLHNTQLPFSTRFVTMAPNVILAMETRNGQELPLIIEFDFDESGPSDTILQNARFERLADPALQPIALANASKPLFGTRFRKLAIFKTNQTYRFYGIPEPGDTATLTHLTSIDLETPILLTGAAYLASKTNLVESEYPVLNQLCLFGEGLYCFDGTAWHAEIETTTPLINALGILTIEDAPGIMAVGSEGSVRIKQNNAWKTMPPYSDDNLTAVSVFTDGSRFIAAGDNGIHINDAATFNDAIVCDTHLKNTLGLNYIPQRTQFYSLARDGSLYAGELMPGKDGILCSRKFSTEREPLSAMPIGNGYFILTPDTLYGSETWAIAID